MMQRPEVVLGAIVVLALGGASAQVRDRTKAGEPVVEIPTLTCAGFHWRIADDPNGNVTAEIEFRKVGESEWHRGLDFMRVSLEGIDYVAGSLFNLEPGTDYEARLTLVDPDGVEGGATRRAQFTTRTAPALPEGGTTYHVYPEGHAGAKQQPLLGMDGDWRAALADAGKSPLKPGDTVALHAGEYQLKPEVAGVRVRPVDEVSTVPVPSMPPGGTTWHVYPLDYEGKKLEPTVRLNHYNTPILNVDRSGEQIVKPGDTVLFHAGEYRVNKHNYRDRLFQGPKWGIWWFRRGGEPGRPVLFTPAGDGDVIFDGSGNYAIFQVAATRHLWIDGLTFRNAHCGLFAGQSGLGAAEGLTVTNCTFQNTDMPLYADTETKGWHMSGNTGMPVVHAGPWHRAFGTIEVRVAGTKDRPIVIRPAGGDEVLLDGGDNYALFDTTQANHVWIRDFKLRNTECAVLTGLYPFGRAPDGLIVTGLECENVRMGVYGDESTGEEWYIADNTFIGRGVGNMRMNQHVSPFGINVCGRGHVVARNRLEWFQDGIDLGWWDRATSYADNDYSASIDVTDNYVFGSGDNSVEADGSHFNGRFLRNAFITCNLASTQSTPGGPYYFIRNVFYNGRADRTFKMPDNIIALHNTFDGAHNQSYGRFNHRFVNNLFVPAASKVRRSPISIVSNREPLPRARSDYNGFHLPPKATQGKPFVWNQKQQYATLAEYAEASGMETHSILVPGAQKLFVSMPEPDGETLYRLEGLDFRLKDGAPAIDAGTVMPNVNEEYDGAAPDFGAIERGEPMPHYGPRQ
jgi:hypothetical protein